jgi:hypothetical protein
LDGQTRSTTRLNALLVAGAGLILGAFCSRVLADLPWVTWPTYRWWLTGALALLGTACLAGVWALGRRIQRRQTEVDRRPSVVFAACFPLYLLIVYLVQPAPNLLQAAVLLSGSVALSLLLSNTPASEPSPKQPHQGTPWAELATGLLLFIIPLIAYLATMTPGVGTRDGYELQAVSATLGFAHPTGYPLFPILGYLWLAIFPGAAAPAAAAWQINLLCALYAAASVPLVYGTARKLVWRRPFAALGALLYAFSHTLWSNASQPEKYTLNALFVALVLYLALGTTNPRERGPHPHMRWLALAYGLSLAHHRTMLMLAPALALYLLWRDPGLLRRPKEWLPALGIALAPLLIYLYIPWRAYAQGWAMTVPEFLAYISGSTYGPAVRLMDWASPERAGMFWRFVRAQYGLVGVGLALVGLYGLGKTRRWRVLACTVLAYATYYFWGTVWYAYYNDVNSFIPNHAIMAVWIAVGVWTIWILLRDLLSRARAPTQQQAWVVLWTLAPLMPMALVWTNGPLVDRSDEWQATRWGQYTIELPIAQGATLLADRGKHPPLDYFARVEGRRPDLDVVILGDERAYLDRLEWDMAHETPVYLARFLPGLESRYSLHSLGPLVRVRAAPETDPGAAGPYRAPLETPARFGPSPGQAQIELLGCQVGAGQTYRAGETLPLTLIWHALWRDGEPKPGNVQVNLRLVSEAGTEWWSTSAHPVSGMYPTGAWRAGEVISDWHEVRLADDLPPGSYRLEVGLFYPFSRSGLTMDGQDDWAALMDLTVRTAESPAPIPNRLRAIAPGKLQLVGVDLPRQAPPSGRVPLRLYWQPLAPLPDYEIGTRVLVEPRSDTPSESLEWHWSVPGQGEYPTSSWTPGQRVITTHTLTMPYKSGTSATVQVAVREHREGTQTDASPMAFVPRWLAPKRLGLDLPAIRIVGQPLAAPGTINYGDRILLLSSDLSASTQQELLPGAPVELTLVWQAAQAMEHDYTLFVQLLAPDGTLKGQIDVWPRDGTHPTSNWREGEPVEDRYLVYLDADAPPGQYRVAVGWYLLETMERVPVLDAEGRAVDDKVLLPGPSVLSSTQ